MHTPVEGVLLLLPEHVGKANKGITPFDWLIGPIYDTALIFMTRPDRAPGAFSPAGRSSLKV
jgi:hypothetical protein